MLKSTNRRKEIGEEMKKDNIFWGVLFLLAAVYLLISGFGLMPDINIVKLLIAVICVVTFVKSLCQLKFGGMLFSAAILLIIFKTMLGITWLSPWTILLAALLGTIGLNMIFGSSVKKHHRENIKTGSVNSEYVSGDDIVISGMFNGYKKNITSDNFKRVKVDARFSGMEISFDDAVIQNGTAVVDLDVAFSSVELYVPSSWRIVNTTDALFAAFDEHRSSEDTSEGPTLLFEGKIRFGGVEVYRI